MKDLDECNSLQPPDYLHSIDTVRLVVLKQGIDTLTRFDNEMLELQDERSIGALTAKDWCIALIRAAGMYE